MSNNQRRPPPGFLNRSGISIPSTSNQAAPEPPAAPAHHAVNRSSTIPPSNNEYNYSQLNDTTLNLSSIDHVPLNTS